MIALALATVLLCVLAVLSIRHHIRLNAFLKQALSVGDRFRKTIQGLVGADGAAVVGVTLFDVVYNALKIEPSLSAAFDHLDGERSFHTLDGFLDGLRDAAEQAGVGTVPWTAAGSPVEVAIDSSFYMPLEASMVPLDGDLLGTLTPDVAVEAGMAEGADGLTDLDALMLKIPIAAILVNVARNAARFREGKVSFKTAAEDAVVDSTLVSIGSLAGASLGTKVGVALAPGTGGLSLVIGPVLGALFGVFAGKGVGSWWKSRDLRAAVKKLKNRAADLAGWFVANYRKVVRKELVRKHRDDLDVFRGELRGGENVFKRWVFPNLRSKVLLRAIAELKKDFRLGPLAYYDQLHKQLKTSEGSRGGMLLYAQGRDKMLEIPPLLTCHDDITLWLRAVDRERVKLERRLS